MKQFHQPYADVSSIETSVGIERLAFHCWTHRVSSANVLKVLWRRADRNREVIRLRDLSLPITEQAAMYAAKTVNRSEEQRDLVIELTSMSRRFRALEGQMKTKQAVARAYLLQYPETKPDIAHFVAVLSGVVDVASCLLPAALWSRRVHPVRDQLLHEYAGGSRGKIDG